MAKSLLSRKSHKLRNFGRNFGINEKGFSIGEGQHGERVHNRFQRLKVLTLDWNKHKKFLSTLEARTEYGWGHYNTSVSWTLRVTLEKKSLSKFEFSEGVPSDSKWSAHISRIALLSVNRLPFTKNALIWDDDRWDLMSFQNNFSFDSTEIHSFFILSSSVWL